MPSDHVVACDFPNISLLGQGLDRLAEVVLAKGCRFTRLASPSALYDRVDLVEDADIIVGFGGMTIDAALIGNAPRLRGLVSHVSGTEGFDLVASTARGVAVAHAPTTENVDSMAEAAMLAMLHLAYDLDRTREDFRLGRPRPPVSRARMLGRMTIGVLGYGRIAARLVELLAPWDADVLVASSRDRRLEVPAHVEATTIDDLLARSDMICILAGATPAARPLIDSERLHRMKRGACLVNLARGSLIDEVELAKALSDGRLSAAALDVFAVEPLPQDSPLRQIPNVVLTPHRIGHTQELQASLAPALLENVLALLQRRLPPYLRNAEVSEFWVRRWG